MDIKAVLKRSKFVYAVNAAIKTACMKRGLKRLSDRYSKLCEGIDYRTDNMPSLVSEHLAKRNIFPQANEKLRILWVGTNWEQDNSGFLEALGKYGEVTNFINSKGKYGLEFCGERYNEALIERNGRCLLEQVFHLQKTHGKVDLVLGQMWANFLPVEVLKQLQNMGIITINISMDDRLPELWKSYNGRLLGSAGLADGLDLVLTSSPECCERYVYHGCPAIYWPMASDPDLFKPAKLKNIDVSFVGNNYGTRGAVVRKLQAAGIKVEAYGSGWPNGPVGPLEAADIFGRSKIIFGMGTIGYATDLYTLKLRDFDATMAGALYVTHRNPDLLQIFTEGEEIECYANNEEAIRKIEYYLKHSTLCEQIGHRAAVKTRKHHTWEKRIGTALKTVGLLDR